MCYGIASCVPIRTIRAELLQRWYYWKLLEFFKAASELSGEGSLTSILVQTSIFLPKSVGQCQVHALHCEAAPGNPTAMTNVQAVIKTEFKCALSPSPRRGTIFGKKEIQEEI